MANLFDNAKGKGTKVKASKHEVVNIPGIETQLSRMAVIKKKQAELEAELEGLDYSVREEARKKFEEMYETKNYFPGTLEVHSGEMKFQFITSDKYLKIDEDRAGELETKFGSNVVTEETTYSFDGALLEKYKEVISDLLMNSTKIAEEDKPNLIVSKTAWSVTKGMIKNFRNELFGLAKHTVRELVEELKPVFSIKNVSKE